ncbi:hypothetical protein GOV10_06585, partial [Candidatus Woesearchaeota archaeon]|nr:hypothetical protein [Candidatus Woesearchaeota archaeon]
YILRSLKIVASFKKLFWVQCIANFWSRLTPGKLGDLGKVTFFPKKSVTFPYAVLEKLLVACALFLLATPIVFIFERTIAIIIIILLLIGAIVSIALLTQEKWFKRIKALIKKVIKKELPPKPSL